MNRKAVQIVAMLLMVGCVNRLELDPSQFDENLNQVVIDGFISDQPGPYFVKVFRSSNVDDVLNSRESINAKEVVIFDDQGNKEILSGSKGFYYSQPNGIRGVVGRSYSVRVELLDGRIFESLPDQLIPPGTLDSVFFEFESSKPLRGPTEYNYRVFVDATTNDIGSQFYRWKFIGTFYIATKVSACWSRIFEEKPTVSDGNTIQGGKFKGVEVGSFPVDETTFFEKFMVQVEQQSLSQTSFNFFKTARDQIEGEQSLFQPSIGQLPTNLFEVNGNGSVNGIFYATSIVKRTLFLKRSDLPVRLSRLEVISDKPCVNAYPNSTAFKPPEWED